MESKIRPIEARDIDGVVNTWNLSLTRDVIDLEVFNKKVILDQNFLRDGCLVAELDGEVVGFIQNMIRRYPYEARGTEPQRGWINVLFVRPEQRGRGIGKSLVEAGEEFFKRYGRTDITVGGYSPNYFFPGVDTEAYPQAVEFFENLGYKAVDTAVAMETTLWDFVIPSNILETEKELNEEGFRIIPYEEHYAMPLMVFLEKSFPGGWVRNARETLIKGRGDLFILAVDKKDEVVGYCQRAIDDLESHFGPFGVREDLRNKKIGTVLFYKMLYSMHQKGLYHAWLAWTGGDAIRFYERAGMRVNRRYAVMKKRMEGER